MLEEKFINGQDIPPLQAVGWEGIFGFIGIGLAMIPLNYIPGDPPFADNSRGTLEATLDAFVQIGNSGRLLMAIIGKYRDLFPLDLKRVEIYPRNLHIRSAI